MATAGRAYLVRSIERQNEGAAIWFSRLSKFLSQRKCMQIGRNVCLHDVLETRVPAPETRYVYSAWCVGFDLLVHKRCGCSSGVLICARAH